MEWNEACERTLVHWRRVLDGLGDRDPLALVAELNEIADICEQARAGAADAGERCAHCAVFDDARECADARWRITDALLDGEFEEARAATMAIVSQIVAAGPAERV